MCHRHAAIITIAVLLLGVPVTAPAQTPTLVSLNLTTVMGGFSTSGSVFFSAAPTAAVELSSSNLAVATVQALSLNGEVLEFTIATFPVAQSTTVTISATSGGVTKTNQLTVLPTVLSYLILTSTVVLGGQQFNAEVGLNNNAPASGYVVQLSSSNTSVATVPASVNVGVRRRTFSVTTLPVVVPTDVTITASAGGVSKSKQLYVTILGLASVTVSGASITGGRSSTGNQVSLTGPTPSDVAIQLASSNTAVATVPASVTILAEATTASFTLTTFTVATPTAVTISASAGGVTRTSFPINVLPGLSSVTLAPVSVVGGQSATGQVVFSAPAPSKGVEVDLSSSNPAVASVPASVTVASVATKSFEVTTRPIAQSTTVTISASDGQVTKTATLNVAAVVLASIGGATPIVGGRSSTGSATIDAPAPSGGFVVQLSSNNPAVVAIPSIVTIPAGATLAEFPIQTFPVAQSTPVTITAFGGPTIKTHQMNVVHLEVASVTVQPAIVVGQSSSRGQVRLNAPADSAGFAVNLSSSNSAVATVPSSITVGANGMETSFPVTTVPVTQSTAVVITATGGGVDKTAQLNVVPATLVSITLKAVMGGGDPPEAQVRLNGPAPTGGLVVNLSSSNTAVATLGAPSVTVEAGATTAGFKVATVTVAQVTPVSITATAGAVSKTGTLNVLPPVPSSVTLTPSTIAGGTDVVIGQVVLSGPAPAGGFAVNLSSSNPAVTAISASISFEAGATTASFKVATVKVGQPTSVNITATAGGGGKTAVLTVTP